MRVAEQYRGLESGLPEGWDDARYVLRVDDPARADRAAALLTAFSPGRVGSEIRFTVQRGSGSPRQALRMLERIDREGLTGALELVLAAVAPEEVGETRATWPRAAEQWAVQVATLPEDWTDLYGQIELASSDFLDHAALLIGPLNPARYGEALGFRFRVGRYGYGAAPEMALRCFERVDAAEIGARVTILRYLADTKPVLTQGPVWYLDGRPV
ncbi:MAG TPA: hypothetical protein VFO03_01925 [Gaiellaceae bacterium]|nr:hypothetical protein [Gaiellaceae bacterium]